MDKSVAEELAEMQAEMARAMSDDAARLMPTVDSHEDLAVVMGACTEEDAICVLFFDAPWSRKSAPLNAGLLELAREMAGLHSNAAFRLWQDAYAKADAECERSGSERSERERRAWRRRRRRRARPS